MTHREPFTSTPTTRPSWSVRTTARPRRVLLHALAACLTAGIANIAAARGVNLTEVSSTVEGDIDLLGILGLSNEVRNGYQQIRVGFTVRGDDPGKLRRSWSSPASAPPCSTSLTERRARVHRRDAADGKSSRPAGRPVPLRSRPGGHFASSGASVRITDTVIIGAGQAGLAASRCLTDRGRDHVVLERGRIGQRWRSDTWDSLHLLTPNWMNTLPGEAYRGPDPNGFILRGRVRRAPHPVRRVVRRARRGALGRAPAAQAGPRVRGWHRPGGLAGRQRHHRYRLVRSARGAGGGARPARGHPPGGAGRVPQPRLAAGRGRAGGRRLGDRRPARRRTPRRPDAT